MFGADCAGGGYRMLLVGLGLLADACRASNTILTLCLCSSVGGGCMAPLRTLVNGKKKIEEKKKGLHFAEMKADKNKETMASERWMRN